MNSAIARRTAIVASLVASLGAAASAQHVVGRNAVANVPAPVLLDTLGMFQAKFASVGDDMFIGGQPTEKALRELKAKGVTTVINLRTPQEMTSAVKFDEAALIKELGMKYVFIPMRGNAEFPYNPEALKTFTAAMAAADGKVLLHCTIAWRASHMWAAYLISDRKMPVVTALTHARSINLMDDMRMGGDGDKQPVEAFLGRTLPEVGRGKP